jgi:hypothetical protein
VEHLLVPHTSWLFGVSTILGKGQVESVEQRTK